MRKSFLLACFLLLLFTSCVSTEKHVVGQGSSLSSVSKNMAYKIKSKYDISMRNIQVSPNYFWERNTRTNLPFSTVLCDTISSELSKLGANITLQETGEKPLKIIGSYQVAKNDVLITVKLRSMGDSSSTDLVVAQDRISKDNMDPKWLEPEFGRLARTLVRILEDKYTGMGSLKIKTSEFKPAVSSQPGLVLGKAFEKYIKDALASSSVFKLSGDSLSKANAVLKGDYTKFGSKLVFHASIVDKNSQATLAGADFETKLEDIPKDFLSPRVKNLDDLTNKIAGTIIEKYVNGPDVKKEPGLVFISKKSFYDASFKAVVPLSLLLAEKFKDIFSRDPNFVVTDVPSADADLVLSGKAFKENNFLVVSASLNRIIQVQNKLQVKTIAVDQEKLNNEYCQGHWFDVDLNGKTDFLMQTLEKKSMTFIPGDIRSEIVINPFKYQNSKHYTKFSDYLEGYMLDYFAASRYFSPVKNVEKRLSQLKTRGERSIVTTKKTQATVAALAKVPYYIEGSFWPDNSGDVEIKATLSSIKGQILASEHIKIAGAKIDPAWLELKENNKFVNDLNTLSTHESSLAIELLTQKGRNNLSFRKGEEIIFFAKANKNVYLKIFTADVDNKIFRIYPNEYSSNNQIISAGEVTSIPADNYSSDFVFQVQGKTGNEMVFAFASDKPLPDLPRSTKTGFYGMTQVHLDVKEIKQWFSSYALKRGISLSWDSLPIKTYE
jgi:hypothetical protein